MSVAKVKIHVVYHMQVHSMTI